MLIPLGTDRPLRRSTLVTYILIGVNFAAFILQETYKAADSGRREAIEAFGILYPPGFHGEDGGTAFHWWQLVTYAFLHAGWGHILGNMLVLLVFGPNIEDRIGRFWFLLFYLGGAVASGLVHMLFAASPVWGASGAIAACTGAYLVLFPRTQVRVLFLLMMTGPIWISAWWFIGGSIAWDLFSQGFGGMRWMGGPRGGGGGVAHLAHLGGYGYGAAVAFLLLATKLIPREQYDLFSIGRQAYRRRQLREAAAAAQQQVAQRWDRAKAGSTPEAGDVDALAAARAEIIRLLRAGDPAGAGAAYKRLADAHASVSGATTLSGRHQQDLGNYFYQTKDHDAAAYAYARFLEAYPRDPDAPHIRLLLALIHARTLNDPIRAKTLINEALPDLQEPEAGIARRELEALG